jgi:peroxin-10
MFTRRLFPGEQRPGYELLGLLLLVQIASQSYLSLSTSTSPSEDPTAALVTSILSPDPKPLSNDSTATDGTDFVTSLNKDEPVVIDLADPAVLPYIPSGSRRCPLCLDAMKDPTAAECGHLFCWTCILRWTGEAVGQGECPICRGKCGREGLLRLAG